MNLEIKKRYFAMIFGTVLIGFGIAVFIKSGQGADPFTLLNLGISSILGVSFTAVQWTLNIIILAIVFFIDKSKIYIATLVNMFGVAPMVQFFGAIINKIQPQSFGLIQDLGLVVIGCIILSIGAGMYIASNLGLAPYDLVGIIGSEKLGVQYKWVRIGTDTICVIIGFFLGEVLGIGTLVAAFCMGPLISFFRKTTEKYLQN